MNRSIPCGAMWLIGMAALFGGPPVATADEPAAKEGATVLPGGEPGAVFESLTITGEDRIRIDFERPDLRLDLDPRTAVGLDWGDTPLVLEASPVDFVEPLAEESRRAPSRYLPTPWVDRFREGAVARFRPDLQGVETWQLTVADSRSDTVAVFSGKGNPPEDVPWDGLGSDGAPVPPGITCSYVLEATDRAGNRRSFVGEGFQLPAYRVDRDDERLLLFAAPAPAEIAAAVPPRVLADVVSQLNLLPVDLPVDVVVISPSFSGGQATAGRIAALVADRVAGDPARVRPLAEVRPDAPENGTVLVRIRR